MKVATKEPLLVVDVGNTSTTLGLYGGRRILKTGRVPTALRDAKRLRSKINAFAGARDIRGVVLSSVVPAVNRLWHTTARAIWADADWLQVSPNLDLSVPVTYPRPGRIGQDRLANACGAACRYGTPVVVADFGTAVTFDVISRTHGYVGGVIAPGLPLMFSYLAEKTALLPHAGPGPIKHAVGKSTIEAMRMGALWGYRGLVREIVDEISKRLHEPHVTLCATGGYAGWVLRGSGLKMKLDPDLTLFGLGRIYELNR